MPRTDKPNILIIWGDDIGYWNISHYSKGMMGYQTPNIDRIAQEGATFTDWYGQQSCTAGRACFITGQNPIRTGLTKVGMPGATVGLHAEDPTIAELLKPLGYATGQFGKNHLGDRDEYLPTVHGFDEFFGNLYHLNAEEEPELPDYPKDPEFKKKFGPRGVLHCLADGKGGQKVEDTGPLTKKRMETIDEEITAGALAWMEKQARAEQPFFLWYNSTAMHFRTHLAAKNPAARAVRTTTATGWSPTMSRSASCSRSSTTLGSPTTPSSCTPPTMAPRTTPGRTAPTPPSARRRTRIGRAAGAFRRSCAGRARSKLVRSSMASSPTSICSRPCSQPPAIPTSLQKLLNGCKVGSKSFKVHLDGFNIIPYVTGAAKESPRNHVMYFSDDGDVMAVRVGDYKFNLAVQRADKMQAWAEPLVKLRVPLIYNLRRDPFERADVNSNTYFDWMVDHIPQMYLMQAVVASQIDDFVKFPPRQKPASFNLDAVLAQVCNSRRQRLTFFPLPEEGRGEQRPRSRTPRALRSPGPNDRHRARVFGSNDEVVFDGSCAT